MKDEVIKALYSRFTDNIRQAMKELNISEDISQIFEMGKKSVGKKSVKILGKEEFNVGDIFLVDRRGSGGSPGGDDYDIVKITASGERDDGVTEYNCITLIHRLAHSMDGNPYIADPSSSGEEKITPLKLSKKGLQRVGARVINKAGVESKGKVLVAKIVMSEEWAPARGVMSKAAVGAVFEILNKLREGGSQSSASMPKAASPQEEQEWWVLLNETFRDHEIAQEYYLNWTKTDEHVSVIGLASQEPRADNPLLIQIIPNELGRRTKLKQALQKELGKKTASPQPVITAAEVVSTQPIFTTASPQPVITTAEVVSAQEEQEWRDLLNETFQNPHQAQEYYLNWTKTDEDLWAGRVSIIQLANAVDLPIGQLMIKQIIPEGKGANEARGMLEQALKLLPLPAPSDLALAQSSLMYSEPDPDLRRGGSGNRSKRKTKRRKRRSNRRKTQRRKTQRRKTQRRKTQRRKTQRRKAQRRRSRESRS